VGPYDKKRWLEEASKSLPTNRIALLRSLLDAVISGVARVSEGTPEMVEEDRWVTTDEGFAAVDGLFLIELADGRWIWFWQIEELASAGIEVGTKQDYEKELFELEQHGEISVFVRPGEMSAWNHCVGRAIRSVSIGQGQPESDSHVDLPRQCYLVLTLEDGLAIQIMVGVDPYSSSVIVRPATVSIGYPEGMTRILSIPSEKERDKHN
jgi:hypothetical protein